MLCPRCGMTAGGKRFCSQCGYELQPSKPSSTSTTDLSVLQTSGASPRTASSGEAAVSLLGKTLNQKYHLEARLGRGGMGTVYRARRVQIRDTVAVKILHPDYVTDARVVERFHRESQAAARLKHPNAVSVYDTGVSEEGLLYIVMEFVEGRTLRDFIRQRSPLTPAMAAEITRQVCAALDEAHRQGVVHRDLKPENINVQQTQQELHVKVLDFGVASLSDLSAHKLTQSGSVVGTPHYMSPEHCRGEELDGRSDVYSMGIVLFEMLTGSVPFNSPTTSALVIQHVTQPPPPLRSINLSISPAVEAVVLRALEKRPEDRQPTAGALAQELSAAVKGGAIAQTPTAINKPSAAVLTAQTSAEKLPATEPVSPSITPAGAQTVSRPGRMFVPLLLVTFLLSAGAALWFWWQSRQNRSLPQIKVTASPTVNPLDSAPPVALASKLWEVIPDQTSKATNLESVLGEPDEQMAIIMPGGQIALDYRAGKFFGNGVGVDLRIYGHEGDQGEYSILWRDDPNENWQLLDKNSRGFPKGVDEHDIHHHNVHRARQILIMNTGAAELHIDAIVAVYKDRVSTTGETHPQQ